MDFKKKVSGAVGNNNLLLKNSKLSSFTFMEIILVRIHS